jgi:DNA-binding MarR family transcriptional regulator
MSTVEEDAYRRLLHQLHRADLLSRRVADLQLGAQLGVGRAMFLILDMVADADSAALSQQAIAQHLGLTKAAVSRHVLAAHQQGWLVAERSSASRRENIVTLTAAGRKLVERGRRQRAEAGRQAAAVLGVREMGRAARTLDRLCTLLEERVEGPRG